MAYNRESKEDRDIDSWLAGKGAIFFQVVAAIVVVGFIVSLFW